MSDNPCGVCGLHSVEPHDDPDDCIKALADRLDSVSASARRTDDKLRIVMRALGLNPDLGDP